MTPLLSIQQAANLLSVSKTKVYQLVEDRKIPHYRLDGRVLFSEEQLEEYLGKHVVEAAG